MLCNFMGPRNFLKIKILALGYGFKMLYVSLEKKKQSFSMQIGSLRTSDQSLTAFHRSYQVMHFLAPTK